MFRKNRSITVIQRTSDSRFSLLKGLLAVGILSCGMLGTGVLTLGAVNATKLSRNTTVARALPQDNMEAIPEAGYSGLSSAGCTVTEVHGIIIASVNGNAADYANSRRMGQMRADAPAVDTKTIAVSDPTVWIGPEIIFTKPGGADGSYPQDRDHITEDMWLTRANNRGISNLKQESSVHNAYPAHSLVDTEWAEGSAEDWQSLNFVPWVLFADRAPEDNLVGRKGVLHLIADDIYIDIEFFSWYWGERFFVQVLHTRGT